MRTSPRCSRAILRQSGSPSPRRPRSWFAPYRPYKTAQTPRDLFFRHAASVICHVKSVGMERHADRRFPARALSVHHQIAQQQDGQLAFADEYRAISLPAAPSYTLSASSHRPRIKRRPFRPLVIKPREQQQALVHRREPRRLRAIVSSNSLCWLPLNLDCPSSRAPPRIAVSGVRISCASASINACRSSACARSAVSPFVDCRAHAGKRANQRADLIVFAVSGGAA